MATTEQTLYDVRNGSVWITLNRPEKRNALSPTRIAETFPDDGYMDMYQVMKALRAVRFNGRVVPDHIPQLFGDTGIRRAGTAYCIAYMRALLRRANAEVG